MMKLHWLRVYSIHMLFYHLYKPFRLRSKTRAQGQISEQWSPVRGHLSVVNCQCHSIIMCKQHKDASKKHANKLLGHLQLLMDILARQISGTIGRIPLYSQEVGCEERNTAKQRADALSIKPNKM